MKYNKPITRLRLWLLLTLLSLCGCSSIPLGSMLKFANFDHRDLISLDGGEIRVRMKLEHPAQLTTDKVKLVLRFDYGESREEDYLLDLKMIKQSSSFSQPLFTKPQKYHHYTFKLSNHSLRTFKRYQREFLQYGKPQKYYWTVYYHLADKTKTANQLSLDLELKLKSDEDYFYLLKEAEIDVN